MMSLRNVEQLTRHPSSLSLRGLYAVVSIIRYYNIYKLVSWKDTTHIVHNDKRETVCREVLYSILVLQSHHYFIQVRQNV